MPRSIRLRRLLAGGPVGLLVVLAVSARVTPAALIQWKPATSGLYHVATNWVGNVAPTAADIPLFNPAGTYTVQFGSLTPDPTVTAMTVAIGNATFQNTNSVANDFEHNMTLTSAGTAFALNSGSLTLLGNTGNRRMRLTVNNDSRIEGGGVLNVGSQSRFDSKNTFRIGQAETGIMNVTGGGIATSISSTIIGDTATGIGSVTVTGAGSQFISPLTIGLSGTGTLNINAGGKVDSAFATYVGGNTGSHGTANVDGANSQWVNGANLTIGDSGNGTMNVTNGGSVSNASNGFIGRTAGGAGVVTVNGPNSMWTNGGTLDIANTGSTAGTLSITNGGKVSSAGSNAGSSGNPITGTLPSSGAIGVSGSGSQWANSGGLNLIRGSLSITGGGKVTNTSASIGVAVLGSASVTVDGSGSQWVNSGALGIGISGTSSLTITNGGQVTSADVSVGSLSGSSAAVDGPGSQWTINGTLSIATNPIGNLSVTNGGVVENTNGFVASSASTTGTVNVSGNGATWTNTHDLILSGSSSGAGGRSTLNIGGGGTVIVGNELFIYPDGVVNLNGGALNVQILSFNVPSETIVFNSGTLRFTNSAVLTDRTLDEILGQGHVIAPLQHLAVVNNATLGVPLTLDGGTFSTGSLINASNLNFVSGTFNLTSDNLTIGNAGLFGNTLELANRNVNVTNATTIQGGSRLMLRGGSFSSGTSITNNGAIYLLDPVSAISGGTLTNTGLITGTGRIANRVVNASDGEIRVGPGDVMQIRGATSTNSGEINLLSGGVIEFTQGLTNNSTGFIAGQGTLIANNAGLTNSGSVTFSGDSNLLGDVANGATGKIIVTGTATATFFDDVTNSGSIRVGANSSAVFLGSYSGNGTTGTGTVYQEGDLRPGFSPANITFGGNLVFGDLAVFQAELGGTTPGAQYDRVNVAASAALAGTLDVDLINGFTPAYGNKFTILIADEITGGFDHVTINNQADGVFRLGTSNLALVPKLDLAADTLTLITTAPGDINLDGTVNIGDFLVFQNHFNDPGDWFDGDFNGDGLVNIGDFLLLQNNFNDVFFTPSGGAPGSGLGTGDGLALLADFAAAHGVVATPEPGVAVLLLGIGVPFAARRRRR